MTVRYSNKCIGITLGDPSGIGPEVVARALAKPSIRNLADYILIGDYTTYSRYSRTRHKNCSFLDLNTKAELYPIGRPNQKSAQLSLSALNTAVDLLKHKQIASLVTAPVCKKTISRIDSTFQGHTEFLAEAFDTQNAGMMFVAEKMKTIIVTRHIPLNQISDSINSGNIFDTIQITHTALKKNFHIRQPTIAVCGLNPHAGEGGTIGQEEIKFIIPAIKKARLKKIRVEGPFAADTLFSPDIGQRFDAIVAMYHDQGLIPIKTLYFNQLVNLTIGLPFIRTSPAHGTAFNIAGQQKADPSSMCEAIKLAANLS